MFRRGPPSWTFGQLESVLAEINFVAKSKRTAFQSRLKNFHRLGFPSDFSAIKGKTSHYGPGHVYEMALAVELTQLGLSPERVVRVLSRNRLPVVMAARLAVRGLEAWFKRPLFDKSSPAPIFVYFDPEALEPLTLEDVDEFEVVTDEATESFFYGGLGILHEKLGQIDPGAGHRLSLVNVTAMLVVSEAMLKGGFLKALGEWASDDALLDEGEQ